ncbi:hypothetical protein P7C70_g204, partial [Phenoliferia sp. Uapishka_3]
MPPRLRSNIVAACSCRRSPSPAPFPPPHASHTYSSTSSSPHQSASVSSEPPPDFLCPSFGFFSRSLPPADRPTPRSAVAPTHWPLVPRAAPGRDVFTGTRRKSWLEPQRCDCGRRRESCMRCRGVATSAKPLIAEDTSPYACSSLGESPDLEEDVEPPKPPPLSSPDVRTSAPPARPPLTELTRLKKQLEKNLPVDVVSFDEKWRRKIVDVPQAMVMLAKLDRATRGKLAMELSEDERLDVVRLYGRIARAPTPVPEESPLLPGSGATPLKSSPDESGTLRRRAGAAMQSLMERLGFDDPEQSPSHARSKASLRIDALALQDKLPSIPSTPPHATTNVFQADLRAIFGPSSHRHADDAISRKSNRYQLQTLGYLLPAWQRAPDGPEQALKLLTGWSVLEVLKIQTLSLDGGFDVIPRGLRIAISRLISRLPPTPSEWLTSTSLDEFELSSLRRSLIWLLALGDHPLDALEVFEHPKLKDAARDDVDLLARTDLITGLTRAKLFVEAEALVPIMETLIDKAAIYDPRIRGIVCDALRALARLSAAQGRTDETYSVVLRLQSIGWGGGAEPGAILMRSRAQANELSAVLKTFNETVALAASDRDRVRLWSLLIGAHVRVNDVEGAVLALDRLVASGLRPNLTILNTLLSGYSSRADAEATYRLFNRFSHYKVVPDGVSYNTLISLHTRRRDPEAATAVFHQSVNSGILPDQKTWTTLMNLFVEAGYWSLVTEIYRYLQAHDDPRMHPDTTCTNVILRATVMAGSTVDSTFTFFRGAVARGFRPDLSSYTLVLQSLCLHGEMAAAEALLTELDAESGLSSLPPSRGLLEADVHVMGVMVHGYLNAGETAKARALLLEMRVRGIQESSIIYGLVVGSFLRTNPQNGVATASKLAEDFLFKSPLEPQRRTLPSRRDLPLVRGTASLSVLFPLIQQLCKSMKAPEALKYFRLVLDGQTIPPIHLYSTLMDGYRRVGDEESLGKIWDYIHSAMLRAYPSKAPSTQPTIDQYHREALCVPFSIFIDSFSDRGAYRNIIHMWKTLAAEGFVFDAGNWNRLGIASCRWNQVEQAFWIAEHVLLRSDEEPLDLSTYARDLGPVGKTGYALSLRPRVSIHTPWKRDLKEGKIPPWLFRRPTFSSLTEGPAPESPIDVGERLTRAQKLRTDAYWRPHAAFLEALDMALRTRAGGDSRTRKELTLENPKTMAAVTEWRELKWRSAKK